MTRYIFLIIVIFNLAINNSGFSGSDELSIPSDFPVNTLDFTGTPTNYSDRDPISFSDKGAWFSYSFPGNSKFYGGFTGPFLMIRDNGVWISKSLSRIVFTNVENGEYIDLSHFSAEFRSYLSHLEVIYIGKTLRVIQRLFFISPSSAVITTSIFNSGNKEINLRAEWTGKIFLPGITMKKEKTGISIDSKKTPAHGYIFSVVDKNIAIKLDKKSYKISIAPFRLSPGKIKKIAISHTFIFPRYQISKEKALLRNILRDPSPVLLRRIQEKYSALVGLFAKLLPSWNNKEGKLLIAKSMMTLQNNQRAPAGGLKHRGLFPSYHYKWFHGFWAWDSWKHASALALYDPELAKDQIRAMYDFQTSSGMIADCVYRDQTIETNNYRNTKPPLSAWVTWKIFKKTGDIGFLKELYPKIILQHRWWYKFRDHDRDGICEYGSNDGTLTAAKWESGMDNGVRFDNSRLLKNSENAWSLDQESIDLNSYLFAEKVYLSHIAGVLGKKFDERLFKKESERLGTSIRDQFYDPDKGWFFDTSIDGNYFIRVFGCEGWIPLWTGVATPKQAKSILNRITDTHQFNLFVPLPTLAKDHPGFSPKKGYWRGPVWLDQAGFCIAGLKRYGFKNEANMLLKKLIRNPKGILTPGKTLRENYNPLTGEGLNAKNFSWTAAHYMLLITDGK